jgi:retron-type reverse transcriptase
MNPPEIRSTNELAALLGIPKYMLMRYAHNADRYYKVFRIQKRSGRGRRTISAPSRELKGLQRWIVRYVLGSMRVEDTATAFRRRLSILDNALPHQDHGFVLNLDLKDFFPTVTEKRVFGLFSTIGYDSGVAWTLARLTTFRNRLPQGAPSSPSISNIVCQKLDRRVSGYCRRRGWVYTRYCDDLTISGDGPMGKSIEIIRGIVEDEGFALNKRKTRVSRRGTSQQVTGLVVNNGVRLPRERRRRVRAMFCDASRFPERWRTRVSELQGHVALIHMIDPDDPAISRYRAVLDVLR